MKAYRNTLGALLTAFLLLSAGTVCHAMDAAPAGKAAAAVPANVTATAPAPAQRLDPLAGRSPEILKKYYLTSGRTYTWTTELVKSLNPALTGLDDKAAPYYLRVDKELTDKYFRHIRAYDAATHVQKGEFLVAKDKSSVWRMDGANPGMIYGSAEKLLKKSRLVAYPRYLTLGGKGFVRLSVPGNVPTALTAKSLNDSVATINADGIIEPKTTGKVDILADYTVGDQKGTVSRRIYVVTQADLQRIAYNSYLRAATTVSPATTTIIIIIMVHHRLPVAAIVLLRPDAVEPLPCFHFPVV